MLKQNSHALALAMFLAFFSLLTGCEEKEQSALDIIKKRGSLRVAVSGDDPPYGYIDARGKNQGYEIRFAKRLAKELLGDTSKIEFIIVEPSARFKVLLNDEADIVLANFTVTDERANIIDFAYPYMKVSVSVVSPKSAPIKNAEELNGKQLIVTKGTVAEEYFSKNYPEVQLLVFEQINEVFQALKDSRGVALAEDNGPLFIWAQENKDFEVGIPSLGSVDGIAPAVKKGNAELLAFINKTIEGLAKEQFFHKNFEATLRPFMGAEANPEDFVVEGGKL
ncbi:MAG: transporter substrate-binding domain-containing protein [Fibromonadales bacterium]|nr:transporter substrate-binding domain-containing protein [Fibromonadales bacterium]